MLQGQGGNIGIFVVKGNFLLLIQKQVEVLTVIQHLSIDKVLMLADDKTKIIPGHRSVSSKQELKVYKIMLITLRNRVQEAINKGKSFNDVSNDSNITKEYKKEY